MEKRIIGKREIIERLYLNGRSMVNHPVRVFPPETGNSARVFTFGELHQGLFSLAGDDSVQTLDLPEALFGESSGMMSSGDHETGKQGPDKRNTFNGVVNQGRNCVESDHVGLEREDLLCKHFVDPFFSRTGVERKGVAIKQGNIVTLFFERSADRDETQWSPDIQRTNSEFRLW